MTIQRKPETCYLDEEFQSMSHAAIYKALHQRFQSKMPSNGTLESVELPQFETAEWLSHTLQLEETLVHHVLMQLSNQKDPLLSIGGGRYPTNNCQYIRPTRHFWQRRPN